MTNEEMLGVAEIVERATKRFNEQAARFRERSAAYDRLIADMNADHERKLAEHRASFGARTEADRQIIEKLRAIVKEQSDQAKDAGTLLGWAPNESAFQAAQRVVKERDGLLAQVQDQRAEIERLKSLSPKYKVGDKLEWQKLGLSPCSVTVTGIRLVYDCIGEGAEYPVGHSEDELRAIISHDTPAGKEAAASVIRNSQMTEIKVGDVVEVVSASGGQTWMADVGSTGKVRRFELIHSIECVRLQNLPGKRNALGGYVSLCDVRKVPQ